MPSRPRKGRSRLLPPELPQIPGGLLDWRHGRWSEVRAQCRYCPGMTNLRDMYGRPSHKWCAEEAARAWLEEQSERYDHDERTGQL